MVESTEKKHAKQAKEELENVAPEKLILDTLMNKYDVVLLARRWAYELQSKDTTHSLSVQEVISQALHDILSGKIDSKTVMDLPPLRTLRKKSTLLPITDPHAKPLPDFSMEEQPAKSSKKEKD